MVDIMKIENYVGSPETFTFPYNPQTFQDANNTHLQVTEIPYSDFHILLSKRALKPKALSVTGHFSEQDKDTQYEQLANNLINGNELKKLYFRDDRFYIVLSPNFQKTHNNNRTNFLDYVFSAITPIPVVFSSTLKTANYNVSTTTWTNGTESNLGQQYTYIESMEITFNGNTLANDTITINSQGDTGITINLGSNTYVSGDKLFLKMISYVETAGIFQTKYWQVTDLGDNVVSRSRSTGKREMALSLEVNTQIDTFTVTSTAPVGDVEFSFRDAYNGG